MDGEAPTPEFFVARDRAMRFARYIREALQERRLHYRGADVGMTTVSDEADEAMAAVVEDARQTVADLLAQRIRDRERGYMEMPLVTAAEGVLERVDLARRMDRARAHGDVGERDARAAVLALLEDALLRLEAYAGAYDEKRPAGPVRTTDLVHVLDAVERHAAWHRLLATGLPHPTPAYDRPPPPIQSDPAALEDVLRAARAATSEASGPWRVGPWGPGRGLGLVLGTATGDATPLPAPERLARAVEVLAFLHPVTVTCRGRPPPATGGLLSEPTEAAGARIEEVTLTLADDAAGSVELTMTAAAGEEAVLDPQAERAVRALMESPPLPAAGPPPPARLVALLGLLRALDASLRDRILPRARTSACRVAASRLPREATRKAPVARLVLDQLLAHVPTLPRDRVEPVIDDAATGRLANRHANAADCAVLLAVLGRDWQAAATPLRQAMDLAPLVRDEVLALAGSLGDIAAVRRDLERGDAVEPARVTRLEQACIAVLGRLGRLAPR